MKDFGDGAFYHGFISYKYFIIGHNHDNAKAHCNGLGAYLVLPMVRLLPLISSGVANGKINSPLYQSEFRV